MGMLIHRQGKIRGENPAPKPVETPTDIETVPYDEVLAGESEGNPTGEVERLSEIEQLHALADGLGITYHPNIGADKLRRKIKEATQ